MPLISLVYVSWAAHDMSDDELQDILTTARNHNKSNNITGMLLYRDRFIIQALEGEKSVVDALFEKIAVDPRHKSIILVYENEITTRTFTNWGMGFNRLSEENAPAIEGYIDFLENPSSAFITDDHSRARRLLDAFRERTFY